MANEKFTLGWKKTILGTVKIVGRPYSGVSLTKGYDKNRVEFQFTQAVTIARKMMTEVQTLVQTSLLAATRRDASAMTGTMGDELSPLVIKAAADHFKMPTTITQGNAAEWIAFFKFLRSAYMMVGQGVRGPLTLIDLPKADKDGTKAYVLYWDDRLLDDSDADGLRIASRSDIHINFHWVTTRTPHRVARTIIHEATHKFIGTRDHAYKFDKSAYAGLTPELAKANADSFACFVYYTWKSGAYAADAS